MEKAYEKYAWVFLFAGVMLELLFGFLLIVLGIGATIGLVVEITGLTWGEVVADAPFVVGLVQILSGSWGIETIFRSVFAIGLIAIPFRRCERWAWYLLWVLPVQQGAYIAFRLLSLGLFSDVVYIDTGYAIVYLLGLLLPYRKFFPREQS